MNKINSLKSISIIFALAGIVNVNLLYAAPSKTGVTALKQLTSKSSAANNSSGSGSVNTNNAPPTNDNAGNTGNSNSSGNTSTSSKSGYSIKVFDPFLDNHLKAPPDGIVVGKFGQRIKEVESELREIGAKNHSYAFGKYSKMVLSSYLITLNFDVNKRLGMVEIEPKPPLKTVEPKAREFFIKFFTEGADLSQIGIVINPEILELRFISPN